MENCIFCKIVKGEIPSHKVYEDDNFLAFLDINPVQPGHTLVVPKIPSVDGLECDPEILAHLIKVAQKIAVSQIAVLECDGVNFLMNNRAAAGQKVFHTHLHVIPRFTDDGSYEEPLHGEYEEGEASKLAEALAAEIRI